MKCDLIEYLIPLYLRQDVMVSILTTYNNITLMLLWAWISQRCARWINIKT